MPSRPTARVRRECAKAGFARRTERLRVEHGLTQAQIGACLGVSESTIAKYEDPDRGGLLSPADIEIIGETYPEYAQMLLAGTVGLLGMRLIPKGESVDVLDDMAAVGRLAARLGTILQKEAAAQADGAYDASEAGPILEDLRALIREAEGRVSRLELVQRNRVDGVRRGPLKAV